jgi:hypothetical protein
VAGALFTTGAGTGAETALKLGSVVAAVVLAGAALTAAGATLTAAGAADAHADSDKAAVVNRVKNQYLVFMGYLQGFPDRFVQMPIVNPSTATLTRRVEILRSE